MEKKNTEALFQELAMLIQNLHLRVELIEVENSRLRGILRGLRHPAGKEDDV